jgi:PST family polysaccharide transporter/teichuronic acid exporter
MSIKSQALKGVQWTAFSAIFNTLIQFLRVAILVRLLEKSDFGLMAIVMMILGFMGLFSDMGIGSAIIHRKDITEKEYSSLYWFNFAVNTVLYFFIWGTSSLVAVFYREPVLRILIPLMGLNLFFTAFGRQFSVVAQKELQFRFISIVEVITNVVSLVPAVVFAYFGWGVYSLIYSTLLASLFSNLFFFTRMRKHHRIQFHFSLPEVKPFLKIGLYQTGGQILNYFNTQFDVIIIGRMLGTEALGIYNLAKNLAMRPAQVINPIITKIAAPLLSKMQDDESLLKKSYLLIVRLLSMTNFPVYFAMAVLARPILAVVYGVNDVEMAYILAILSLCYMLRSIGNPVGGLVVAKGRTDIEFYWNIGMFFFFPICTYIGCMYSVIAAAFVQLLMLILTYIPGWYFLIRKLINARLGEYMIQSAKYLLYSLIASIISYWAVFALTPPSNILIIICGLLPFGVVYLILLTFFDKEMITFFKTLKR